MMPFHHVLVPTDFSDAATRALDFAVQVATASDAKLTLLHVLEDTDVYYGPEAPYWPSAELARIAQDWLDGSLAELKKRYPRAEATLVKGRASEKIISTAKDRGSDLIVIGTHGRKGLAHVFLGSVAEKVVRRSPIPVLTVGPEPKNP